jgi:glycosyltransferase involved in cell wall biosynthesis
MSWSQRVTVFLPSLVGGGAERSIATLASGLAAHGVDVTLALATASGPYLAELHPRVQVLDLRASSAWSALPALARHLRANRPDALLAALSHANVIAAIAHRLARSRARLVLSERAHLTSLQADFPGPRMRATVALMRFTYPRAHRIVAVSDGVAEDLAQRIALPRERIVTIHNPVVNERLHQLAGEPPRHPWLVAADVPVILAAGRLIAQKDFATLLDAFVLLRRQRTARLVILGEGELRGALEQQAARLGIAQDVSLPGFEANPFAAMRAAAVFVLSSRFEGLPGVLIQAMACGTRVVSTDCPSGPREVLEGGRWGALVPVGDAAALALALATALDEREAPDVRARAAAFSEERALARYADVLGLALPA